MFTVRVHDIFYIRGRGMVLAGRVESGTVCSGARALLLTPVTSVAAVLAGLERNRTFITSAAAGEDVALLFREVEPSALAGGVERVETRENEPPVWKVLDLKVEEAPKRWWEFWK